MSKMKRFLMGQVFIVGAVINHHYGLEIVAIPMAIVSIIILGSILKEELGI